MGQRLAKRPRGTEYAGLSRRGRVIYFETTKGGKRVKVSLETEDWAEALEAKRILLNRQAEKRRSSFGSSPTFAQAACDHLCDLAHLATRTKRDRRNLLRGAKELVMGDEPVDPTPLVRFFGRMRLDEIGTRELLAFWRTEVVAANRSTQTGKHMVNVVEQVYLTAMDAEQIGTSPVPEFRARLKAKRRGKLARAEQSSSVRPVTFDELARLLTAAEAESPRAALLVRVLAHAGLRLGEARALTWGCIKWGEDASDLTRALRVSRNLPTGVTEVEATKSGKPRTVGLSRALRSALRLAWVEAGQPGPGALVFPGLDGDNFRAREWRRICERAGVGHRALKDLRDTFASQLLTAGVQLGYISAQLGHADVATTAKHYAAQVEGQSYSRPAELADGELPADLIERGVAAAGGSRGAKTHTTSHTTPHLGPVQGQRRAAQR